MTDLQDIMDAMGDAAQSERSNYHVTLGDLLVALEDADGDLHVEFSDGSSPTNPHSYRGYYQDLAFETIDDDVTVAEFREVAEDALGKEFTGWKGGQFTMGPQTPLWQAERGTTAGSRPVMSTDRDAETFVLELGDEL